MVSAAVGVVAAGWGIAGRFTMAAAEDTSRCVSDVVERDLSCRTRISSFSESPGQPRYGSGSARWTVWAFSSAGQGHSNSPGVLRYGTDTVFATKWLDIGDDLYFGQLYVGYLMNGPILEP